VAARIGRTNDSAASSARKRSVADDEIRARRGMIYARLIGGATSSEYSAHQSRTASKWISSSGRHSRRAADLSRKKTLTRRYWWKKRRLTTRLYCSAASNDWSHTISSYQLVQDVGRWTDSHLYDRRSSKHFNSSRLICRGAMWTFKDFRLECHSVSLRFL